MSHLRNLRDVIQEARSTLRGEMRWARAPWYCWLTGYFAIFVIIPILFLACELQGIRYEDAG